MAYLRTEWGVQWSDDPEGVNVRQFESALRAREFVDNWNAWVDGFHIREGEKVKARVVQRQISDWGDDE